MTSLNGFVFLYRRMLEWGWYKNSVVKDVFLHLLLTANYKETKWQNEILKKGEVVTSVKSLSESLGFSTQQVRTALNKLKLTNEISVRTTNKYSVITVLNWEFYQCLESKGTARGTSNPTINQQQRNKDNNYKKRQAVVKLCDVEKYAQEKRLNVNPTDFFSYYESRGWKCNGESITDWKKLLHSWAENERSLYAGGYNTKNMLVEEKPAYLGGDKDV